MPNSNSKRVRVYSVHDNGGRPYQVYVDKHQKFVHVNVLDENKRDDETTVYRPWKCFVYSKIWIGRGAAYEPLNHPSMTWTLGNTILIELQTNDADRSTLVVISRSIQRLTLPKGETVRSYVSLVGNSDVPYNYIVTNTHVYFPTEKTKIPLGVVKYVRPVLNGKNWDSAYTWYHEEGHALKSIRSVAIRTLYAWEWHGPIRKHKVKAKVKSKRFVVDRRSNAKRK